MKLHWTGTTRQPTSHPVPLHKHIGSTVLYQTQQCGTECPQSYAEALASATIIIIIMQIKWPAKLENFRGWRACFVSVQYTIECMFRMWSRRVASPIHHHPFQLAIIVARSPAHNQITRQNCVAGCVFDFVGGLNTPTKAAALLVSGW